MNKLLIILLLLISNIGYSQTTINICICERSSVDSGFAFLYQEESAIYTIGSLNYLTEKTSITFINKFTPEVIEHINGNLYIRSERSSSWGESSRYEREIKYHQINLCYEKYIPKLFSNFEPLVIIPKLYKRRIGA